MQTSRVGLALTAVVAIACAKATQAPAPAPAAAPPQSVAGQTIAAPEVGANAPNFAFTPVTKDGIGKPKKLSDYKGQTVVLWFFIKARTRG